MFIDFFQDLGTGYDDALGHATKTLLTIRSVELLRIDFFQDLGTGHDDALGHATKTLLTIRSVKLPRVVSYPIMLLTFRSIPRLLVQAAKI